MLKKLGYSLVLFIILVIASGMTLRTTGSAGVVASPDQTTGAAHPAAISRQTLGTAQWQQLSPTADPSNGTPAARFNHALAYHPGTNTIYLFGGQAGSSYFNDVWALDLDNLTWERLFANTSGTANTTFPVQRRTAVMTVDDAGQNLYIATGQASGGTNYNDIWRFVLSTNSWTKLSSSSTPGIRYGAAGGNLGGDLIVSHGFQSGRYDDTWRFDVNSGQWQDISPATNHPVGRCLLDGAAVGDTFIIHGGQSDADSYRADTWLLNTVTQTWSEIATGGSEGVNKPDGRRFQSLVGVEAENGALLFGGVGESSTLFNDVWFLDLAVGTWSELAPSGTAPTARRSQAGVWIEGSSNLSAGMLLFGGTVSSGDGAGSARNEVWLLAFPTPGAVQFSGNSFAVTESNTSAVISVTRTGGVSGTVTVDYATGNGSASAGQDYTATSGTLTFNNGEGGTKSFSVPIIEDTLSEGDETINLILQSPTNGATLGTPSSAVLTILDSDTAGNLQFSTNSFAVSEMGGSATISVTRTGGVSGTVTVDYATGNGSASAGQDYTATSGTLTFNNGSAAAQTFTVPIIDNPDPDGNKTVNLSLTNPTGGATLANPSTAVLTIDDDETVGAPETFIFLPTVLKLAGDDELPSEHDADLEFSDIFLE